MGKVASDKCHKWVFKEPIECEPNSSNYWQSSFDAVCFYIEEICFFLNKLQNCWLRRSTFRAINAFVPIHGSILTVGKRNFTAPIIGMLPPEWTDQFESGIETIAVIQAGHGLLQLGSCKIIPEDLHFVLRMRHTFESLGYQSEFYLSQLFPSTRNASSSSSSTVPLKQPSLPIGPPPPLFNCGPRTAIPPLLASPSFRNSAKLGIPPSKNEAHVFLNPHSSDARMEDMIGDHENDL